MSEDNNLKVCVMLPCFGRPEYTQISENALSKYNDGYEIYKHTGENGLRNAIIDFFEYAKKREADVIAKIDNDCVVNQWWMNKLIKIFEDTDVDILSPNVYPSNAAFVYGEDTEELIGYRKASIVGGLWCMDASLLDNMVFTRYETYGIKGAIALLKQIINEKDPNVGWTTKVTIDDVGHWSGSHPSHIKSKDHAEYSECVGRRVAWESEEKCW